MAPHLFFLVLPLVAFASLAALPPGRPALIGLAVAALAVAVAGPRIAPEDGTGFGTLVLWLYGGAVALAALAQGLRFLSKGRVPYPLLAGLCLLGAVVPAMRVMGVF